MSTTPILAAVRPRPRDFGAKNEWWIGDSNSNDGEEFFATIIGGAGLMIVLTLAALPVSILARRGQAPALRAITLSTLCILILCIAMGVLSFIV